MTPRQWDLAVVGAGPAGAAAALAAADAGCRVAVVDTYRQPGGQYLRAPESGGAPKGSERRLGALPARLLAHPRVEVRAAETVWTGTAGPPHVLYPSPVDASPPAEAVTAGHVVLATGAVDRVLPFPGWDLPGVFTAGGAQALVKGHGVLVGRRSVVAGSGPFLLPVAASLARAGGEVVLVAEAARVRAWSPHLPRAVRSPARLREAAGYAATLARHRVRVRHGCAVVAARGDGRVEEVDLADVDRRWARRRGSTRTFPVDALCASFGFVAQIDLALVLGCRARPDPLWGDPVIVTDADQATSVRGIYAAGEVTGVAGAQAAAAEGTVAGLAAARAAGRLSTGAFEAAARRPRAARNRHRAFAAALADVYGIRSGWLEWLRPDTVVCRCEEVPYGRIRQAVDEAGAVDLRSVKMTTRCGMGFCQGRMCGPALARLLSSSVPGGAPADPLGLSGRPIVTPVPLGTIAQADGRPGAGDEPHDVGGDEGHDAGGAPAGS